MVFKLIDINLHLRAQSFYITLSSLNFDNDKILFFNCFFFNSNKNLICAVKIRKTSFITFLLINAHVSIGSRRNLLTYTVVL